MKSSEQTIVLFIDRCLGKHPIAEVLRETGVQVEVHDDHFAQNALDLDWIPMVGRQGWVILTKDARIGRNALERQAVARSDLRMFTLTSQKLTGAETAEVFRQALAKILKFVRKNPAPFIAKVYKDGRVTAWKTAEELLAEIT